MPFDLNLKAIAFFSATGFFPEEETYFKNINYKYSPRSSFANEYNKFKNFKWHYSPVNSNLKNATVKFAELFESIIKKQTAGQKVILPLSGGLDSRTQAVALQRLGIETCSYSYSYSNGHDENSYGRKIAEKCGFSFKPLIVKEGYLWNCIEDLSNINHCYSDFTHPRQMAFVDEYKTMGDVFSLGHWGDVLFDGMSVPNNFSFENQVDVIQKKIVRKGGYDIADALWQEWQLEGSFHEYLRNKIEHMLKAVYIPENANASVRAFKSRYWATRWTASNFSVFEHSRPVTLPYYDTEMCDFICRTDESILDKRQIQVEYVKKYAPEIAKIKWQEYKPFNLFNYQLSKSVLNLPFRIAGKLSRTFNALTGKKFIQRNWELQFLGESNKQHLASCLLENKQFESLVPKKLTTGFMNSFYNNPDPKNAHSLGILLTLSLFIKNNQSEQ